MRVVNRSIRAGGGGTLLLFGINRLDEMLAKGNVWYIRNYETHFNRVYVVYLAGYYPRIVRRGTTILVSLGRRNILASLLIAPIDLYLLARRICPARYLTPDIVLSWWTASLLRILDSAKVILMPVCMPELIYKNTGRSLLGVPIGLERLFTKWSFRCAETVLTGHSFGGFVNWLSSYTFSKNKLVVVDSMADALPTEEFFARLEQLNANGKKIDPAHKSVFEVIHIGRLHREKLVEDVIKMMSVVVKAQTANRHIILTLIGDGPERSSLEKLVRSLGLEERVRFIGRVPNERLPDYLCRAQAYISPLTGSALREAALCGLPIVAYNMDWVEGLFKHEETALLVPARDYEGMAREIFRLYEDEDLCAHLSKNVRDLAWRLWSHAGLDRSLEMAFSGR